MVKIDCIRDNAVYLVGDVKLEAGDEYLSKEVRDSRLFVRKTNIEGIFKYGAEQTCDEYMGHGKGYIWSSRASVMNKEFDTALIEAYYKNEGAFSYQCCAIDPVRFEQLLNEAGYEVNWKPIRDDDTDRHYSLRKKKEENKND